MSCNEDGRKDTLGDDRDGDTDSGSMVFLCANASNGIAVAESDHVTGNDNVSENPPLDNCDHDPKNDDEQGTSILSGDILVDDCDRDGNNIPDDVIKIGVLMMCRGIDLSEDS